MFRLLTYSVSGVSSRLEQVEEPTLVCACSESVPSVYTDNAAVCQLLFAPAEHVSVQQEA